MDAGAFVMAVQSSYFACAKAIWARRHESHEGAQRNSLQNFQV
jgi:hypothetical protein